MAQAPPEFGTAHTNSQPVSIGRARDSNTTAATSAAGSLESRGSEPAPATSAGATNVRASNGASSRPQSEPSRQEVSCRSCMTLICDRGVRQAVGGFSFSMGSAWKSATLAVVNPDGYLQDPEDVDNVLVLWMVTIVVLSVLMAVIAGMLQYQASLARKVASASQDGDRDRAFWCRVREKSVDAIINWGLTFTVAAQLDGAVQATIPKSPAVWRIVYLGALLVVVSVGVVVVRSVVADADASTVEELNVKPDRQDASLSPSTRRDSRSSTTRRMDIAHKASDTLLTGCAYVTALAVMGVTDAIFKLQDPNSSVELDYLGLYALGFLLANSVVLPMLTIKDNADAVASAEASDAFYTAKGVQIQRAMRRLLGKAMTMSAVVVAYAFIYVALSRALGHDEESIYDPLPIGGAFIFFGVSLLVSAVAGVLLQYCTRTLVDRLEQIDTDYISGKVDDYALDTLECLAETTKATFLEGLAWLVGVSLYSLVLAIWDSVRDSDSKTSDNENILVSVGIALILTPISVLAAAVFPPRERKPERVRDTE